MNKILLSSLLLEFKNIYSNYLNPKFDSLLNLIIYNFNDVYSLITNINDYINLYFIFIILIIFIYIFIYKLIVKNYNNGYEIILNQNDFDLVNPYLISNNFKIVLGNKLIKLVNFSNSNIIDLVNNINNIIFFGYKNNFSCVYINEKNDKIIIDILIHRELIDKIITKETKYKIITYNNEIFNELKNVITNTNTIKYYIDVNTPSSSIVFSINNYIEFKNDNYPNVLYRFFKLYLKSYNLLKINTFSFVLYGEPGIGKSYLCRNLIKSIKNLDEVFIVSIFESLKSTKLINNNCIIIDDIHTILDLNNYEEFKKYILTKYDNVMNLKLSFIGTANETHYLTQKKELIRFRRLYLIPFYKNIDNDFNNFKFDDNEHELIINNKNYSSFLDFFEEEDKNFLIKCFIFFNTKNNKVIKKDKIKFDEILKKEEEKKLMLIKSK